MARPVTFITGCSSGLGLSVAVKAAQSGHRVYATMRNLARRDALDAACAEAGVEVEVLRLDVQEPGTIADVVATLLAREGRIDALVANAGIGYVHTIEQADIADAERVFDINVFGVMRCVKAVLPHMRAAGSGRVVAISSVGGLVGQPFNEIYCASKFAVEGFMESLASYAGPEFGLHFSCVEPGGIRSAFAASVMAGVEATGGLLDDAYLPLIQSYLGGQAARGDGVYQTPDAVADVVMDVLADPAPPIRVRTSAWSEDFTRLKTAADPTGKKLQAKVMAQMLGGPDT